MEVDSQQAMLEILDTAGTVSIVYLCLTKNYIWFESLYHKQLELLFRNHLKLNNIEEYQL